MKLRTQDDQIYLSYERWERVTDEERDAFLVHAMMSDSIESYDGMTCSSFEYCDASSRYRLIYANDLFKTDEDQEPYIERFAEVVRIPVSKDSLSHRRERLRLDWDDRSGSRLL